MSKTMADAGKNSRLLSFPPKISESSTTWPEYTSLKDILGSLDVSSDDGYAFKYSGINTMPMIDNLSLSHPVQRSSDNKCPICRVWGKLLQMKNFIKSYFGSCFTVM
ncbi:hypothetical protein OROMI_015396 [Orobanche minor]